MLKKLYLDNFLLFNKAKVSFDTNFISITGETASGKSLLLEALNLLFNIKSTKLINDDYSISAIFNVDERDDIKEMLKKYDIRDDLILSRITKKGRTTFEINDKPSSSSIINSLSPLLLNISRQNSNMNLYDQKYQLRIIDSYIDDKLLKMVEEKYNLYKDSMDEYLRIQKQDISRSERLDYLSFSIKALDEANLKKEDEDKILIDRLNEIKDTELIYKELNLIYDAYYLNDEFSLRANLIKIRSSLDKLKTINSSFEDLFLRVEAAIIDLKDVINDCQDKSKNLEYSEREVDKMNARLATLQRLMRKYGPDLKQVIEKYTNMKKELDELNNYEDYLKDAQNKMDEYLKDYEKQALILKGKREEVAKDLSKRITSSLRELDMKDSALNITLKDTKPSAKGSNSIEFLIKTNKGSEYKEIKKVASGGEVSRIFLAIMSVISNSEAYDTIIFDEIDTGIGGIVSLSLAKQLKKIAENKQVFVITHQASIAATTKEQILVVKKVDDKSTYSLLNKLDEEERVKEIARMLSGHSSKDISLEHARDLLRQS